MSDDKNEKLPVSTKAETALDLASIVSSIIPWIGGPVSNVLSGMSLERKISRVGEVLELLSDDLKEFKSEASENYVKTEEFEDLLEQTLKKVGDERNKQKRHLYKEFLTEAIKSPSNSYDEQLHLLRTFELLTLDQIQVLKAITQDPDPQTRGVGSPLQTLMQRLPEFDERRIDESVMQLNSMNITDLSSLRVMMTGRGASDLRQCITGFGNRIVKYIYEE